MCHSKGCRPWHLHNLICITKILNSRKSLKAQGSQVHGAEHHFGDIEGTWTRWWWLSNGHAVALSLYQHYIDHTVLFHLSFTITAIKPILQYHFQMPLLTLFIFFLAILSCGRKWPQKEFLGEKPRSSISEICSQSLYPNNWCLDKEVHRHSDLTE